MTGRLLRLANTLILALISLLTLTGVYGLVWPLPAWMFEAHRIAGWSVIALIPWKAIIVWNSLRRGPDRRFDRSVTLLVSLILAIATLLVIGFGLLWTWRLGPYLLWLGAYADTAVSWHWMLALALLLPFAFHVWRRWPRPKRADFLSRRSAFKLAGLGAAGLLGWWAAETLAQQRATASAPRSFTGSREQDSFSGLAMPITHSLGEGKIRLDPETWRLRVQGPAALALSLSYAELLALSASETVATLDCTTGWYSTQIWRGIWLTDLLKHAALDAPALGLQMKAVSGYLSYFTMDEAREILLATHVGGEALDHGHGFPLRAVVPSRRGWHWVKWIVGINMIPAVSSRRGPRDQPATTRF